MRISEAARRLGTSARMLRYREEIGLLPAVRGAVPPRSRPARPVAAGPGPVGRAARGPAHRQFGEDDLAVLALALDLERQLDVSPAELAFGIRVLAEPAIRAQVAGLARRLGRIPAPPGRALDFEQERALRLLGSRQPAAPAPGRPAPGRPGPGKPGPR